MKIAVCDDDKAAREHIVSLIKEQMQDAESFMSLRFCGVFFCARSPEVAAYE